MIDFDLYSEYINIVKKTNSIFDAWFFSYDKCKSKTLSKKKYINQLSFSRQTEEIMDLLIAEKAPPSVINAFRLRKEVESQKDISREKVESILAYVVEVESEYKAATLS